MLTVTFEICSGLKRNGFHIGLTYTPLLFCFLCFHFSDLINVSFDWHCWFQVIKFYKHFFKNQIQMFIQTFLLVRFASANSLKRAMCVSWYVRTKSSSLVSRHLRNLIFFRSHWLFSIIPCVLLSFVKFWKEIGMLNVNTS